MTTITFDTLKFTQRLEQAGIPHDQAVAMVEAQKESLSEIMEAHLATKLDVQDVKIKQVEHDGQFALIKWMLGILVAGVLSIVIKTFF
ncbi:MAG: DUF1640 domain-containing protein [Methylobacter sp.]